MNWIALVKLIISSSPTFIPIILRKLADEIEKDPTIITKLLEHFEKKS